jgi:hypothetical protein
MSLLKNVGQFIEGYLKMLGDLFHLLPLHEKEQVYWRSQICKDDCAQYGYCIYCGCDFPGKIYVEKSCNGGERFPNLMSREEWEKYKLEKKIEIDSESLSSWK